MELIILRGILYIILIVFMIGMSVSLYYHIKKDKLEVEKLGHEIYANLELEEKTIKGMLEIIDIQINLEIAHSLLPYAATSKEFNPINTDHICNDISLKVFQKINEKHLIQFTRWNRIYNYEFWMDYIIKKTTCSFVHAYLTIKSPSE